MPNIEFIPLSLVDDYDKNSNTHPQAQIENIKALMLYVGWTVPALVRKTGERYGLIAGHGRRDLCPLGVRLLTEAVACIRDNGFMPGKEQDEALATWEPSLDAPPVHRPDLLLLGCDDDTDEVIAENMAYLRSYRMYMSAEQAQSCP